MAKPEWGVKRTCPKCSTRFYDLQKADPVTCIDCGHEWLPESILKSKQTLPQAAVKKAKPKLDETEADDEEDDLDLGDDDEDIELDDDDDVDITVEDDDEDDDVSSVVSAPVQDDD